MVADPSEEVPRRVLTRATPFISTGFYSGVSDHPGSRRNSRYTAQVESRPPWRGARDTWHLLLGTERAAGDSQPREWPGGCSWDTEPRAPGPRGRAPRIAGPRSRPVAAVRCEAVGDGLPLGEEDLGVTYVRGAACEQRAEGRFLPRSSRRIGERSQGRRERNGNQSDTSSSRRQEARRSGLSKTVRVRRHRTPPRGEEKAEAGRSFQSERHRCTERGRSIEAASKQIRITLCSERSGRWRK